MTRAKEITKEAKKFAKEIDDWEIAEDVQDAFEQGAVWADAHPRWIAVKDKLPMNSNDVLVCDSYGYMRVSYYHKVLGRWSNCDTYFTPTHWMPLPPTEGIRGNQGGTSPNPEGGDNE